MTPIELTGRSTTHVTECAEFSAGLHSQVLSPFRALRAAAARDRIDIAIASGFRDFERQRAIWNAKFDGQRPVLDEHGHPVDITALDVAARVEKILLWSALPGASRHHWGTDLDLYDRGATPERGPKLVADEYLGDGPYARLFDWLDRYAADFGFYRPYATDRGGVRPEPWHWSYAPLATRCVDELTVEVLGDAIQGAKIAGHDAVMRALPALHRRYVRDVDVANSAITGA